MKEAPVSTQCWLVGIERSDREIGRSGIIAAVAWNANLEKTV